MTRAEARAWTYAPRWIVRANTPGGHRWVVGQAGTVEGLLNLVHGVPRSDAVRVERWIGQTRINEGGR